MKNSPRLPLFLAAALLGAGLLSACTPLGFATGAVTTTGVAAARDGGIKGTLSDLEIQAAINDLWFKYDLKTFAKLDMTVNQGRVLITGIVQDPEDRVEAVRLAWQPTGVKQVINEIQIADSPGVTDYARDAWIATRLRTALTFDSKVRSINYTIDVVKGIVYLMGVAQNQMELNHVIEKARTIPDVKRVVSYVKLTGEPLGPDQSGPPMEALQPASMQPAPTQPVESQPLMDDPWPQPAPIPPYQAY